jgi:PAS domain S-box-containing protein
MQRGWSPRAGIVTTTLITVAIGILCLSSGYFIIFQNLFYIPIIIACICYGKRGFALSVAIAAIYFCLILAFTREATILLQALVRSLIFILIAATITYLSLKREAAVEVLQKHRELLSEITGQVPSVVYQFYARPNGERGLYYVSPRSEQLLGLKPDRNNFLEKFTALVVSEHREDFLRSIDQAVQKVAEWKYEGMLEKPSGEKIWFSGNSIPLKREKEIVFNGMITDITERKRMEEEKQKVAELRALAETKSKFTAVVSHELRSPLAVVREALDILWEGMVGDVNDEQKEVLGMAKTNIDRLSRLINSVLDFQRMESGKMEFDMRENDLKATIAEAIESLSILSVRKNLDLTEECEEELPKIKFDRDRLIQVLTNLVSNAFNNTEKGGVTVDAKKENNAVHVSVRDTGKGIRVEDIPKIFEPFKQVEKGKGGRKGGSGLGLAISKEIILAHHGKIWAESEVGKGTTFHFTLPVA